MALRQAVTESESLNVFRRAGDDDVTAPTLRVFTDVITR